MNTALKHRLVGTIIVVALLVIFLPDYLDGQKQTREDIQVLIPKVPDALTITPPKFSPAIEADADANSPVQTVSTINATTSNESPDSATTESEMTAEREQGNLVSAGTIKTDNAPSVPSTLSVQSEPVTTESTPSDETDLVNQTVKLTASADDSIGWVVQLGSFKHQKNVNSLLKKLDDAGYRAFTRPINTSAGRLTKVFIGPDIERDALENKLGHLKELTGLNGRITPFKAN